MGSHAPSAGRALDALRTIVQALRASDAAAARHGGLSGAQLFILRLLAPGTSPSVTELARRTRTHQSSVSVVVDRLVRAGLAERQRDPVDGRRRRIAITAAGREALRRSPVPAHARLVAAVGRLPAPDQAVLARLLGELARTLGRGAAAPAMFLEPPAGPRRRRGDVDR
jgi:DNA-binding MarR family transcriptional regulator